MEIITKTYQTLNGDVEGVSVKWQGFSILMITGTEGFLACPAIDVDACEGFGKAAAIVESGPANPIVTIERLCERKITKANEKARGLGLKEGNKQKISDWMEEQGIALYDEMNEHFSSLTIQLQTQELDIDNPKIQQMTFMALYNIDRFKDFVFKSTFLDRLEVEPKRIEEIKNNDEQLLIFAYDWIKFGLFGKKVFWVKQKAPITNQ